MTTGRALAVITVLAVQSVCVLGASYASYPNPVGQKVFRPHLLQEMLPVAIIISALLLAWLLHATQRKAKTHPSDDVESHHD
jgi:protein-S-isoprenylcysteine O-methyltransferase Ste14